MRMPKANAAPDFYVTGGTLRRDAACYVARQADRELYDGLCRGDCCYVLTSRQMGKSSLMVRTAARLREDGVTVAVLDLTAIGQNLDAAHWYYGLLGQIGQQLDLEDEFRQFWLGQMLLGPLQRWLKALREVLLSRVSGPVVVFVDEIDTVRSLPFPTDEFFAGIRELYNARTEDAELRRLSFCLLGVATPSDLIRDTRMTPFNIGRRVELGDFTEAEALLLAQGLRRDEQTSQALLKRVRHWTDGHPYLTQRLCHAVANDESVRRAAEVDHVCAELFLSHRAQERDDNLLFVRERILRSEVDTTSLLTLYSQVRRGWRVRDDETNPLTGILRLSGVARVAGGELQVRNRIYERVFDRTWVAENMPDAELRRQRAAYRKGLLRAATVAMVIIAAMASLVWAAVRQRDQAETETRRADQNFQQATLNADEARSALTEAARQRQDAIEHRELAELRRAEAEQNRQQADDQRQLAQERELTNRRLLYAAHMNLAQRNLETSNYKHVRQLLSEHYPLGGQTDFRGFEWYHLWRLAHQDKQTLLHGERAFAVAISPDGRTIFTGGDNGFIKLWDAATGREIGVLHGRAESQITSIVLSYDGKILARNGCDDCVELWDVVRRQHVATFKLNNTLASGLAFSPDNRTLAMGLGKGGIVSLWDVGSRQEIASLKGHTTIVAEVAFSPDGSLLSSAGSDQTIVLWDVAKRQNLATLKGHTGRVRDVKFSPDGKLLASASSDKTVRLWDVARKHELANLVGHTAVVQHVAFSPDGKSLASSSNDHTIKLWDVAKATTLASFEGHADAVEVIAFTPDGQTLISTSMDKTAKLWNLAVKPEGFALREHTEAIWGTAIAPDAGLLATGSHDRTVRLWDLVRGQGIATFTGHTTGLHVVTFSPDRRILASGDEGGAIRLWDISSGKQLFVLQAHRGRTQDLSFSPDGRLLASSGLNPDQPIKLWDIARGTEIARLNGHKGRVHTIAFSPDGKTLASGSGDGGLKLWDIASRRARATFNGHSIISMAFSQDGKMLATGGGGTDQTAKLWDVIQGREVAILYGHADGVDAITFSSDGRRLATGSIDGVIKLWDVASHRELITFNIRSRVLGMAFSPDNSLFTSVSFNKEVRVWRTASEPEVVAHLNK